MHLTFGKEFLKLDQFYKELLGPLVVELVRAFGGTYGYMGRQYNKLIHPSTYILKLNNGQWRTF